MGSRDSGPGADIRLGLAGSQVERGAGQGPHYAHKFYPIDVVSVNRDASGERQRDAEKQRYIHLASRRAVPDGTSLHRKIEVAPPKGARTGSRNMFRSSDY